MGAVQRGQALIAQEAVGRGNHTDASKAWRRMQENHENVYLALASQGVWGAGQVEEGLAAVAEALRLVEKNDERFYEAEVYRIKGALTLQSKAPRSKVQSRRGGRRDVF